MENRITPPRENPAAQPARQTPDHPHLGEDEQAADPADTMANESEVPQMGADIGFDRVVGAEEAGLGGGLDQAEEAQLGVTDEELAEMAQRRGKPRQ